MAIRQTVTIDSTPEQVYKALTSAKEFNGFTGAPAEIAAEEGGAFACFGGQIIGRHIELSPHERIIQAWRAGPWPEGAYSIVRFDLSGSEDSTTVELTHTGYPEGAEEHLDGGWHKMYWEPLKAFLA